MSRTSLRKTILSGMVGNGLEWYDYAIYGQMAVIIGKLFFPSDNALTEQLSAFAVFAVSFVARPFGGLFFGLIGDRFGRRVALSASVVAMALATGAIGLMPTYAQIGVAAPVLLVIVRVVQGLSIGGEFSGAITYMVEHAPPGRRGIVGSMAMVSLVLGFLAGSFTATILSWAIPPQQFEAWGWRIPFLLGIVIGAIGFYIRRACDESPVYEHARAEGTLSKTPARDAFLQHPLAMVQGIGIYFLVTMPFYLATVYFITFDKQVLGMSVSRALALNTACMVAMLVAVPLSAWCSDRIGRKKVLCALALVFLVTAYPVFAQFTTGDMTRIVVAQVFLAALIGLFIGPVPAVLAELFPTAVRYTGMAISYNIAAAAFGGTAPMVAATLIEWTGTPVSLAWYVMLAAVCGFVASLSLRKSAL